MGVVPVRTSVGSLTYFAADVLLYAGLRDMADQPCERTFHK